jgi:hypothetical protein
MTGPELQAIFGGRWDGGGREIHGLLNRSGRNLKIELLRASEWVCSVFDGGSCVATVRAGEADDAVRGALESLEP